MKNDIFLSFAVAAIIGSPFVGMSLVGKSKYPEGFIPLWSSQNDGHEVVLLNVRQITRIEPMYDSDDLEPTRLYVYFEKGHRIEVSEPYEQFKERMLDSLK
jgi:hypothetical protein